MTKTIALTLGMLLILAGVAGFVVPGIFGLHLSSPNNLIYLVSGFMALYFGTLILPAARSFCKAFGTVWLLLAAIGFLVGGASGAWILSPSRVAFGPPDHFAHFTLGTLFLLAGCFKNRSFQWPPNTHN